MKRQWPFRPSIWFLLFNWSFTYSNILHLSDEYSVSLYFWTLDLVERKTKKISPLLWQAPGILLVRQTSLAESDTQTYLGILVLMCVLLKIGLYYSSLQLYRHKYNFRECCSLTTKQSRSWELGVEHQLCQGACKTGYRTGINIVLLPEPMWVQKHGVPTTQNRGCGVNKPMYGLMPATTQHCTPGPEMVRKRMARKLHGATGLARSHESSLALIKVWLQLRTAFIQFLVWWL